MLTRLHRLFCAMGFHKWNPWGHYFKYLHTPRVDFVERTCQHCKAYERQIVR